MKMEDDLNFFEKAEGRPKKKMEDDLTKMEYDLKKMEDDLKHNLKINLNWL
jgi:hypothetical protein